MSVTQGRVSIRWLKSVAHVVVVVVVVVVEDTRRSRGRRVDKSPSWPVSTGNPSWMTSRQRWSQLFFCSVSVLWPPLHTVRLLLRRCGSSFITSMLFSCCRGVCFLFTFFGESPSPLPLSFGGWGECVCASGAGGGRGGEGGVIIPAHWQP